MGIKSRLEKIERRLSIRESPQITKDRLRDRAVTPMAAIRYAGAKGMDATEVWKKLVGDPVGAVGEDEELALYVAAAWQAATQMDVEEQDLEELAQALGIEPSETKFEIMAVLAESNPLWFARRYRVMNVPGLGSAHYEICGYPIRLNDGAHRGGPKERKREP